MKRVSSRSLLEAVLSERQEIIGAEKEVLKIRKDEQKRASMRFKPADKSR
jgi:hypothetical protein